MFNPLKSAIVVLGLFVATHANAQTWTLDSARSVVAFGSIKKDTLGEAHTFERLSGTVDAGGVAEVQIDLASVQTNIDIRNERLIEHVFGGATTALLKAEIDMASIARLDVGESTVTEIEGDLLFLGQDIPVFLDMFVMRTAQDQVLVTSNSMIFVSTEEAGIDAGIDMLTELADLSGITRTFPATLRLIFNADA